MLLTHQFETKLKSCVICKVIWLSLIKVSGWSVQFLKCKNKKWKSPPDGWYLHWIHLSFLHSKDIYIFLKFCVSLESMSR